MQVFCTLFFQKDNEREKSPTNGKGKKEKARRPYERRAINPKKPNENFLEKTAYWRGKSKGLVYAPGQIYFRLLLLVVKSLGDAE